MKRGLSEIEELDHSSSIALANCLMLLSQGPKYDEATTRVFECKTCNRQFSSFQALGGHRASHKKPKVMEGSEENQSSPPKSKTHECSICGLEFPVGQALGGHMRRHRAGLGRSNQSFVPIVKKSNSRTVLCLDLNLTPMENIDLQIRKAAPIDCFL